MTDTELRRQAENATPGPWEAAYDGAYPTGTVLGGDGIIASCDTDPGIAEQCMNAVFIAAASPDVVIGLLDRIKALEVELDEARDLMPWRSDVVAFHQLAERAPPCDAAEDLASWCMMILRAHAAKGGE